jgi:hypothetical protein
MFPTSRDELAMTKEETANFVYHRRLLTLIRFVKHVGLLMSRDCLAT